MMKLASRTPMQLFAQSACGMVVGDGGFVALQLDERFFGSHIVGIGFMMIATVGAGFWLSINAEGELRNGIAAARWPEEQIERVRGIAESRWMISLMVLFIVAACILMFPRRWHLRGYGWACLMASQSISRLCMALKRSTSEGPRTMIWDDLKPINSEHWGGR